MLNYCGMRYVKMDEIILIAYVVVIVHAFIVGKAIVGLIVARLGDKAIVGFDP